MRTDVRRHVPEHTHNPIIDIRYTNRSGNTKAIRLISRGLYVRVEQQQRIYYTRHQLSAPAIARAVAVADRVYVTIFARQILCSAVISAQCTHHTPQMKTPAIKYVYVGRNDRANVTKND